MLFSWLHLTHNGNEKVLIFSIDANASNALAVKHHSSKQITLKEYLPLIGKTLHCYFTLESGSTIVELKRTDTTPSYITMENDIGNLEINFDFPTSEKALINKLENDLPDILCVEDKNNPHILHLIEKNLLKMPDYVMQSKVSMSGSMLLCTLPDAIGRQFHNEMVAQTEFITGDTDDDSTSRVVVNVKSMKVRDVLTDFVPLKNYSRIIWTSIYMKDSNNHHGEIWVRYYGKSGVTPSSKPIG